VTTFPDWLEPMAATLTQDRFAGPEWIFERKYDGIRLLAFKRGQDVRLYSRNRLLQNHARPRIVAAVAALPNEQLILDGEATWGRSPDDVEYYVFDMLWRDQDDLRALPLHQRRALLALMPFREPVARVPSLDHAHPWEHACAEGWEGVIAKRRDAPYEHRRSKNWLKMKCELTREFVIGGFTDPQRSRVGLGALLVGYFEGDEFIYAGKVGTGFDTALLLSLRARLDALEIPRSPFTKASGLPRVRAHWVRPELVAQVAFTEWTVHDKLRHSRLLGVN
jgi:bifunctional non-homologous end joining protein LigD